MEKVMVAGSAHFDIIAKPMVNELTKDMPGSIKIEAGGTAYNIACNLAWLGLNVSLVTALRKSPFSDILLSKPYALDIDVQCVFSDAIPIGGFSAHLDNGGELQQAISEAPVEKIFLTDEFKEPLQVCQLVVADCNLNKESLSTLISMANKYEKPVFVSAVSEEKGLKLVGLTSQLHCLFLNRQELAHLMEAIDAPYPSAPPNTEETSLQLNGQLWRLTDISQLLGCHLIVTDGANGVYVASWTESAFIPALPLSNPENMLGMGDLLLSLVVAHLPEKNITYASLLKSLTRALPEVVEIASVSHCNLGDRVFLENELDKVSRLMLTDHLTGITNLRGLYAEIESTAMKALFRKGLVSVIMVDIDFFKKINDTYGHDVGDQALIALAATLKDSARETDIVARLGGEEFLVVVAGETESSASLMAERLRNKIAALELVASPEGSRATDVVKMTASFGVAQGEPDLSFQDLRIRADTALYRAKNSGRNRVTKFSDI